MAELRKLAGGRADLLAEVAGILEGASEGQLDKPLARCAARSCRLAAGRPGDGTRLGRGGPGAGGRRLAVRRYSDPRYRRHK